MAPLLYAGFILALSALFFSSPVRAVEDREVKILMLGDSLTAGYGVMPQESWPSIIQEKINAWTAGDPSRPGVRIINAGISGSTTASAPSRLAWQLKAAPDIMLLALGANDGLRGLSVSEMEKNLEQTIQAALEKGVQVILAGMEAPPNMGEAYTKAFRNVYTDLADRYHLALIPFLLKNVAGHPSLNQSDGVHPLSRGHKIIAETVYPYILEALDAGS